MGLLQKDVAREIGASMTSLRKWEVNQREPTLRFIPGIIGFLGYVPWSRLRSGPTGHPSPQLSAHRSERKTHRSSRHPDPGRDQIQEPAT